MARQNSRRVVPSDHVHYGWIIAAATIVLSFFCQAATSPSSQYISRITDELGITRGAYMVTSSISSVIGVIFGMLYGPIARKTGPKRLMILSALLIPTGLLINSFSHSLWPFYLTSAMSGMAYALGVSVSMSIIIKNWFAYKQGTLIGIMLASGSAGGAIFTQIAVRIVADYGWRISSRASAAMLLLIALPCLLIIKETPEEKGLEPFGYEHIKGRQISAGPSGADGLTFREAIFTPRFWLGAIGFFMLGACAHPILGSLPAYVTDSGFSDTYAGLASGLSLLSAAAYKLILGNVYDRKGITPLLVVCFAGSAVASFLFCSALSELTIITVPLIFGAALCGVTMVPMLYVSTALGQKEYATFSGIFLALIPAGSAIGNPVLGAVYDATGSYKPALLVMTAIAASALVLVLISLRGKRYGQPGRSR